MMASDLDLTHKPKDVRCFSSSGWFSAAEPERNVSSPVPADGDDTAVADAADDSSFSGNMPL